MKHQRLRLERIATRSTKRIQPPPAERTVIEEAAQTIAQFRARLYREHHDDVPTTSLLDLFNIERVDFVKQLSLSRYVPVEWPKQATHRLQPTSWNTEPTRAMPKGSWALSVCAVPLRRIVAKTAVVVRKPFPDGGTAYNAHGPLDGKRNVLRFLVEAMKAKVPLRALPKLSSEECDLFYAALRRASTFLKLKKSLR